jgi:hypothetical protein
MDLRCIPASEPLILMIYDRLKQALHNQATHLMEGDFYAAAMFVAVLLIHFDRELQGCLALSQIFDSAVLFHEPCDELLVPRTSLWDEVASLESSTLRHRPDTDCLSGKRCLVK